MTRRYLCVLAAMTMTVTAAQAASERQPAPANAPQGAPDEFTQFTATELTQGFLAVAFGSDLRVGSRPKGIRRFTGQADILVLDQGSRPRGDAYRAILREFGEKVPSVRLKLTQDVAAADIVVRLIDEKNFVSAIEEAFGRNVARRFIAKTDPQCVTSVKSDADGKILRADVFVIVDQGDTVFYDCAYHETLHALGLSNHADTNPWTMLNQNRVVGYLTMYDRALLTLLYDPRIRPGMSVAEVRRALPLAIAALPFARRNDRR